MREYFPHPQSSKTRDRKKKKKQVSGWKQYGTQLEEIAQRIAAQVAVVKEFDRLFTGQHLQNWYFQKSRSYILCGNITTDYKYH